MNKTFRSVWNARKQTYVAAAESVSARGKPCSGTQLIAALAAALGVVVPNAQAQTAPPVDALPSGGQVSAGQAAIHQSGANMVIRQGSDRAAINWQTFNVGQNAHVQFQQPGASSVTLNRVMSADPSQIFGRISANGQVILTNPSGVYFGRSAKVDVGGLVATTHHIGDADFMSGSNRYERNGNTGSVINEGELKAALGGYIALLAPEVRNQGAIIAQMGTVALAAGEAIDLHFDSNNRLTSIRVEPSQIAALVENKHAVQTPGGLIILAAQSMDRLIGGVVKNSGRVEANGLQQVGGRIVLSASHKVDNTGSLSANASAGSTAADSGPAGKIEISAPEVVNSGSISATGVAQHSAGGVLVQATNFTQTDSGRIDLSAPTQGGLLGIQTTGKVQLRGQVDVSATQDQADNTPTQGGQIDIVAQGDIEVTKVTLDASGGQGGQIQLRAAAPAQPDNPNPLPAPSDAPGQGRLAIMGNSTLSTRGRSGKGGNTTLLGDHIDVLDATHIDSTGATGGGTVLVGGDWQGSNGVYQATTVTMGENVVIDASATENGDGGKVVLWSDVSKADSLTTAQGTVLAQGGAQGGNGGQVETSGHSVDIDGLKVATLAASGTSGEAGQWLIDPSDYTIGSTQASTINSNLGSTNVTIQTGTGVNDLTGTGHIYVDSALSWSSSTSLTLRAFGNIINSSSITHYGTGSLILRSRAGSVSGGTLNLGSTSTAGSNLVVAQGTTVSSNIYLNGYTNFKFAALETITVDALVGGGGGGGGGDGGGGGGGGGVAANWWVNLTDKQLDFSYSVGAGGVGGWWGGPNGTSGGSSSLTFKGTTTNASGGAGGITGPGGGGGSAGAGGGSGGAGTPWVNSIGSTGGNGYQWWKNSTYYGGGGGGGVYGSPGAGFIGPNGGAGGGGKGADYYGNPWATNGYNGADGFGGGGGGGAASTVDGTRTAGGSGGSGTVVLHIYDSLTGAVTWKTYTSGSGSGTIYTYNTGGINANFTGAISGAGKLTVDAGNSTMTFSGANTYSGGTTVASGVLKTTTNASALGSGAVTLNNVSGVKLDVAGNLAVGSLIGGGATGGHISLGNGYKLTTGALNTDTSYAGVISGEGAFEKTGSGTLTLTANQTYTGATTISDGTLVLKNDAPTRATSGFSGAGALRVESVADSFSSPFSTSGWVFGSTLGGLTIGKTTNTADINIASGYGASIAGPISIYGGGINLNANLTSTLSGAAILAKARGNIAQAFSVAVTTNNGSVTYWSDSDSNHDGAISLKNRTQITTNGGDIVFGGGTNPTTAAAYGNSTIPDGIVLFDTVAPYTNTPAATLNAGGGTIRLNGQGWGSGQGINSNVAVSMLTTGTGNITLTGTGGSSGAGVVIDRTTLQTQNGDITILATAGSSSTYSLSQQESPGGVSATGTGRISMTGIGKPMTFLNTSLGSNTAAGSIVLQADAFTFNGTTTINTSGSVTLEPVNPSFSSALVTSSRLSLNTRIGGLTLGKSTNTANITTGSTTSINGPISIYGGNITLNANLASTLSDADILLKATGNITQAAGVGVTTSGGDVTYWADSDGNNSGRIELAGASGNGVGIFSGGGNIILGGGSDLATGYAQGGSAEKEGGIDLHYATLNAGSGSVLARAKGTGTQNYGYGLYLDNSSLTGHDISLTGLGSIVGAWANIGIAFNASTLSTSTGAISLLGYGGMAPTTGGGNQRGIDIDALSSITASGAGSIALTGYGGSLPHQYAGSQNFGVAVRGGLSTAAGGTTTINGYSGLVDNRAVVFGAFEAGLTAISEISTAGSLTVNAYAGPGTTTSGDLQIATKLALTGASNTLTLNAAGSITQSAAISAANLSLLGGNVTLTNESNAVATLNASGVGILSYADQDALTAIVSTTGDTSLTAGGNLVVSGSVTGAGSDLSTTTTNSGTTSFGATTVGGNLSATSAGALTDSGELNVTGTTTITATGQNVTLDTTTNDFGGLVTVTGAAVTLQDKNALTVAVTATGDTSVTAGGALVVSGSVSGDGSDLSTTTTNSGTTTFGATTVGGNLIATSAGAVTDSGELNVTGTTTLTAGANNITLDEKGNDFTGAVSVVSGKDVTLVDANALDLGASTVSGNLAVTTGTGGVSGGLSQSGALSITGSSTFTADKVAAQVLTLNNTNNVFGGTLSAVGTNSGSWGAVQLQHSGDLVLGSLSASSLVATATGSITNAENAALSVANNASLSGTSITLGGQTGDSINAGSLTFNSAGAVSIAEDSATELAGASTAVSLILSAKGAITDGTVATLAVTSTSQLTARDGTTDQAITLDNSGHDFGGEVTATGAAITLKDKNALTVAVTATGDTTLTAGGALVVSGTVSGADSDLSTTTTNSGTTSFGPTTVSGNLSVTSAGAVSQTGALDVTGNASFSGTSITLQSANKLGAITVNAGTGDVAITEDEAMAVASMTHDGKVTLTAAGAITGGDGTTDTVNVTANALVASAAGAITLDTDVADLTATTSAAGAIALAEKDAVTLTNVNSYNGAITVTAGGAVTATNVVSTADADANDISISGTSIAAGVINAGAAGDVILSATTGAITDNNAATLNITADNLILGAATGISTAEPLELAVNSLTGTTTGGAISLANSPAGTVTINGLTTGDVSHITYAQVGRNLVIAGAIGSAGGNILIDPPVDIAINANVSTTGAGTIVIQGSGAISTANGVLVSTDAGALTIEGAASGAEATSLTMADNSGIASTSGMITLRANTMALDNVGTGGNVLLDSDAAAGAIATQGAGTAGKVTAANLTVQQDEASALTIATAVTSLNVVGGNTVTVVEDDDIVVNSVATAAAGTFNLTATAGAITEDSDSAADIVTGTANLNAVGGIDVDTTVTSLTAATTGAGSNIQIDETDAITLSSVTTTDGAITVNAGDAISATSVTAGGTGRNVALTTTAGNISVGSVMGADDTVTLNSAAAITDVGNDGTVDITGGTVALTAATGIGATGVNSSIDVIASTVSATNSTSGGVYINSLGGTGAGVGAVNFNSVAANTAGNVELRSATHSTLTAVSVANGSILGVVTGSMTVGSVTEASGSQGVSLTASDAIIDGNGSGTLNVSTATGLLALSAATGIDLDTTAATATLTNTGSGAVVIRETDALSLGASSVAGSLSLTTGGALSQTAALTVTGTSNINAGANDVTLDTATNDFTGTVTVGAGATTLVDANALAAALTTTGDTSLTAGGALGVSGRVSGADSDLILAAEGKTTFGDLTVDRNLTSTTRGKGVSGGVSQTAAIVVGGLVGFVADEGAGQNALLNHHFNDFQDEVSFTQTDGGSWQALTLVDGVGGLTLGDVAATGKLDATAATNLTLDGTISVASLDLEATGGDITQSSGTLSVSAGSTDLKAGDDITLAKANDFVGTVNVAGANDVVLNDLNSLTLGDVTMAGKLDATAATDIALEGAISVASLDLEATGGDITQNSGTLSVSAGPTDLKAGDDITLDGADNDFNGTVNVAGANDVVLNDLNSLVLGNVAARGNLGASAATSLVLDDTINVVGDLAATAGTDLALNGTISAATAALEARAGNLTQRADSALVVSDAVTLTAGDSIALAGRLSASDTALNARQNVTLDGSLDARALALAATEGSVGFNGAVTAERLTASAGADITQAQSASLRIANRVQLAALGDIDLGGVNDFQGAVSAEGDNVSIRDINELALDVVTARKNLQLTSNGNLSFGITTVGGELRAQSGNGDMTQTGVIKTQGRAVFEAGLGVVTLTDAGNTFPLGTRVTATRYVISGDAQAGARQQMDKVISSMPVSAPAGTNAFNAAMPAPLVLASAAASSTASSSGGSASGAGASASNSSGVSVDLVAEPAANAMTMVAVSLAQGAATAGAGFTFVLPEEVRNLAEAQTQVSVSLPDGSALPAWLRFDQQTMGFEAVSVPDGAFPLQVVVTIGAQRVQVVVSEKRD